jgi:hypothetical protein
LCNKDGHETVILVHFAPRHHTLWTTP